MKILRLILILPISILGFFLAPIIRYNLKNKSKNWIPEIDESVFVDTRDGLVEGILKHIYVEKYLVEVNGITILYPKKIVYKRK